MPGHRDLNFLGRVCQVVATFQSGGLLVLVGIVYLVIGLMRASQNSESSGGTRSADDLERDEEQWAEYQRSKVENVINAEQAKLDQKVAELKALLEATPGAAAEDREDVQAQFRGWAAIEPWPAEVSRAEVEEEGGRKHATGYRQIRSPSELSRKTLAQAIERTQVFFGFRALALLSP